MSQLHPISAGIPDYLFRRAKNEGREGRFGRRTYGRSKAGREGLPKRGSRKSVCIETTPYLCIHDTTQSRFCQQTPGCVDFPWVGSRGLSSLTSLVSPSSALAIGPIFAPRSLSMPSRPCRGLGSSHRSLARRRHKGRTPLAPASRHLEPRAHDESRRCKHEPPQRWR